jgi:peptidoglycan-N-acetylglucosamine deacetylase
VTEGGLTAISIDLDGLDHYRAIHGLPSREEGARLVYEVALARAIDFARAERLPLTLFAIGRDLRDPRAAEALVSACHHGHQVENHSLSHRYDLTRCDAATMAAEVRGGAEAIERATGRRPRGFRAPGYLVSDRLFSVLRGEGVAWDSSVFPSPAYYLAKLAALARLRVRGEESAAVVGDPRGMVAPRTPYLPGGHWYAPGEGDLLELPIAVTRALRLPVIGTTLAVAGPKGAAVLARGCARDPVVSLELHAVDFLDVADGLDDLARAQRDLRVPVAKKLGAIAAAVAALRAAGHRFATVDEAAQHSRGGR